VECDEDFAVSLVLCEIFLIPSMRSAVICLTSGQSIDKRPHHMGLDFFTGDM